MEEKGGKKTGFPEHPWFTSVPFCFTVLVHKYVLKIPSLQNYDFFVVVLVKAASLQLGNWCVTDPLYCLLQ